MFIDTNELSDQAPAERNVPTALVFIESHVAPLELLIQTETAFYKHCVPTGLPLLLLVLVHTRILHVVHPEPVEAFNFFNCQRPLHPGRHTHYKRSWRNDCAW